MTACVRITRKILQPDHEDMDSYGSFAHIEVRDATKN